MKEKRIILVVDDNDFDRRMLMKALAIKGHFETLEASSGEECRKILETKPVGLVLMDILMPGEEGTTTLRKIRERFNPIELPVIMVTSITENHEVISCLQCGANDYITKPVNFEAAVSRISAHLRLSEISAEMSRLKEISAIAALVTTYNHEINNPLAIAMGCLQTNDLRDPETVEKLKTALWRISDIVKKIDEVYEKKDFELQDYAGTGKMMKLR